MSDSDAKQAWVERVLGFEFGRRPATSGSGVQVAIARWRQASEAVDGQIARLQAALKASGDPQLKEIAEFGLNGVTGGHKVRLAAALIDLDRAADLKQVAPKAVATILAFRSHLDKHPPVALCDDNPFGVPVAIRATLGPALDDLGASLRAVA